MKISVVTISFNQAQYLRACLDSVLLQDYPHFEYIVIDGGSTDGSAEILDGYRTMVKVIVSEPDNGPADALNKGLSYATGDVFYYLNSDDIVLSGAFGEAIKLFKDHSDIDVVAGAGMFIAGDGSYIRRLYSDKVSRSRLAYGSSNLVQPATFFRLESVRRVGGFRPKNASNWDDELVTDLYLAGAKFKIVHNFWGGYRLHSESITASSKLDSEIFAWYARKREKLGIAPSKLAWLYTQFFRIERVLRKPSIILERLTNGPIYGRMQQK